MKKSRKLRPSRAARSSIKLVKWVLGLSAIALVLYAFTHLSSVAYTDKDLGVVDFSTLDAAKKRTALESVNRTRCTCGCGMTLAQCVATDSTCPLREDNIAKIRNVVAQSRQTPRGN
jgi:hypothetical protein